MPDSTLRVLHVEDEDVKARSVERLIQGFARRAGFAVQVDRARTLAEAGGDLSYYGLIVVDWCFPTRAGAGIVDGLGASIVELAAEAGVPAVVVSGGMRFPSYRGTAIWENDWTEGLGKAFELVKANR